MTLQLKQEWCFYSAEIIKDVSKEYYLSIEDRYILFIRGVGILIEEIIKRYKDFMEKHYRCQSEAAEELHISRSHLNKIINRRDNPSTTLLIRMEEVMKKYGY